jgi:hypothetical protein
MSSGAPTDICLSSRTRVTAFGSRPAPYPSVHVLTRRTLPLSSPLSRASGGIVDVPAVTTRGATSDVGDAPEPDAGAASSSTRPQGLFVTTKLIDIIQYRSWRIPMALSRPVQSPSQPDVPRQTPRSRRRPWRSSPVARRGLSAAAPAPEQTRAPVQRRKTRINGIPLAVLISAVLWALILLPFFGG